MNMIQTLFLLWVLFIQNKADKAMADTTLNGFPCSTEDYPFMVKILKKPKLEKATKICGGSLIGPRHALTAASCLGQYDLLVIAGIHDPIGKPEIRKVIKQIPHDQYTSRDEKIDIAILVLDEGISSTKHIKYAVFPKNLYTDNDLESYCKNALTLSWAVKTTIDDLPEVARLQCDKVPVVVNEKCVSPPNPYKKYAGNICTSSPKCKGDPGGPILCGIIQVAVISWKTGCDNQDQLQVHTRTDKYMSFISKHVRPLKGKGLDGGTSGSFDVYGGFYFLSSFIFLFNNILIILK